MFAPLRDRRTCAWQSLSSGLTPESTRSRQPCSPSRAEAKVGSPVTPPWLLHPFCSPRIPRSRCPLGEDHSTAGTAHSPRDSERTRGRISYYILAAAAHRSAWVPRACGLARAAKQQWGSGERARSQGRGTLTSLKIKTCDGHKHLLLLRRAEAAIIVLEPRWRSEWLPCLLRLKGQKEPR